MSASGRHAVLAQRMDRQGIDHPLERTNNLPALFRRLQPVAPLAMSYPGSPPRLVHRTTFNDGEALDVLRRERRIVKARFQHARIGYVAADELELYATAFRKPVRALNDVQERVLDAVSEIGPADSDQIKAVVDGDGGDPLLKKQIMPALSRMQQAFLVFEDQTETDWERPWCEFSSEWPDIDLDRMTWEEAVGEVVRRFLYAMVFATDEQVSDWTGWSKGKVRKLLETMEAEGQIHEAEIDGLGEGYLLEVVDYDDSITSSCRMLHKTDFLVTAHSTELESRYADQEVLQYLLIDGEFQGAVLGHWRIGPHDVDDVVVELPEKERVARKAEILIEVKKVYSGRNHEIICYDGKDL